jgi:hypothetical protein
MSRFAFASALFLTGVSSAFAGAMNSVAFFTSVSIPTLDEVGLLGLTIVVAIAGGIAARRRKKK